MALYAFDGTGNEGRISDEKGNVKDSNVVDFFRAYIDPEKDDDPHNETGSLYLKGIGRRAHTLLGEKVSEAFGIGGHRRVRMAMERLENNFDTGDMAIDIIGFSRGAALAISFANTIADRFPHVSIRFIGVWDIVGEFGAPGKKINAGHDLSMPHNVEHCYHAMAMDESRALFPLTRLGRKAVDIADRLQEVWFRGVHSDVGGGNGNACINCVSLNWMYQNALRHKLPILDRAIAANLKDGLDQDGKALPQTISDHGLDLEVERRILAGDLLHSSVRLEASTNPKTPHNNPPEGTVLARIDDTGLISRSAALA